MKIRGLIARERDWVLAPPSPALALRRATFLAGFIHSARRAKRSLRSATRQNNGRRARLRVRVVKSVSGAKRASAKRLSKETGESQFAEKSRADFR